MYRYLQSLQHALNGLRHAVSREKSIRSFIVGYLGIILLGIILRLNLWEWTLVIVAATAFLGIELLNTALERLVDAVDECRKRTGDSTHFHPNLKATKDVASAAAFVTLLGVGILVLGIFLPKIL